MASNMMARSETLYYNSGRPLNLWFTLHFQQSGAGILPLKKLRSFRQSFFS
jgi:hypothetical protein